MSFNVLFQLCITLVLTTVLFVFHINLLATLLSFKEKKEYVRKIAFSSFEKHFCKKFKMLSLQDKNKQNMLTFIDFYYYYYHHHYLLHI